MYTSLLVNKREPRTDLCLGGQGEQIGSCSFCSLQSRLAASTLNSTRPWLSPGPHMKLWLLFLLCFSSSTCLKENEWSVAAHHSSVFFHGPDVFCCYLTQGHVRLQSHSGECWRTGGAQGAKHSAVFSISLIVILGEVLQWTISACMSKPCFADSWWGRFRTKPRNYLTEAVLDDQGLSAVLLPLYPLLGM